MADKVLKLERLLDRASETLRQGHELLQAFTEAERRLKALMQEARGLAPLLVDEAISAEVEAGLEVFREELDAQMEDTVRRLVAEYERIQTKVLGSLRDEAVLRRMSAEGRAQFDDFAFKKGLDLSAAARLTQPELPAALRPATPPTVVTLPQQIADPPRKNHGKSRK